MQESPFNQPLSPKQKYLYDASALLDNDEMERVRQEFLLSTQVSTARRSQLFSRQNKFDTARVNKKLLNADSVRNIIDLAFQNFRGKTLSQRKLKDFECRVFCDCYIITAETAAKRILDLVENVKDTDYIET